MAVSSFTKFESYAGNLQAGVHSDLSSTGHTLKWYLSNVAPDAAADSVKADIAEIATGNGYAGPVDAQNDQSTVAGQVQVTGVDAVITASGGAIATFQYAILFDDDAVSDELIGWWDRGSPVDLADGDSITIDVPAGALLTIG